MFHANHSSRSPHVTGRRAAMAFSGVVLGLILAVAGCGGGGSNPPHYSFKDPSGEPVKAVVRTTVPLAYAASIAMSSVTGSAPSNAAVIYNNCTTSPAGCAAVITINDDNSALPLQFSSYGTITVYGYWISQDEAILTVVFGGSAGSSAYPVHHISVFPVLRTTTGFMIVYVNVDVDISTGPVDPATLTPEERLARIALLDTIQPSNDASVNVDMDAWVINVDNAGTQKVSDDAYRISGGGQYVEMGSGSASILQLGMVAVSVGPGCALNPTSGLAALNEVAASSSLVAATALLSFGPSCDGNSKVTLATGNYLLSNGDSIPLNLNSL